MGLLSAIQTACARKKCFQRHFARLGRRDQPAVSGQAAVWSGHKKGPFCVSAAIVYVQGCICISLKVVDRIAETAEKPPLDTLMIVLPQPKAVGKTWPLCYQFFGKRYHFVSILYSFLGYVFICIVSRGKTHGVFLRLFKCRVRKIFNCRHGKCGRSRPLGGCGAGRGTRPTRHSFRAAAGADADLGRSAPRIANGPRFATPGAG